MSIMQGSTSQQNQQLSPLSKAGQQFSFMQALMNMMRGPDTIQAARARGWAPRPTLIPNMALSQYEQFDPYGTNLTGTPFSNQLQQLVKTTGPTGQGRTWGLGQGPLENQIAMQLQQLLAGGGATGRGSPNQSGVGGRQV